MKTIWASLVTEKVKNLLATQETGLIPGEGNGYPLQYSCLENTMNRGAWQATVHGITNRHDGVTFTSTFLSLSRKVSWMSNF